MKNIIYLLLLAFCGCKTANNFYQGRVKDEKHNPIEGVTVTEYRRGNETKTDKNGYFKLNRSPNWLGELIFVKEGYKNDTIPSVWHQSGETIQYNFIYNDTMNVILKSATPTNKN